MIRGYFTWSESTEETTDEDLQSARRSVGRAEGPRGLADQGGVRRTPHRRRVDRGERAGGPAGQQDVAVPHALRERRVAQPARRRADTPHAGGRAGPEGG